MYEASWLSISFLSELYYISNDLDVCLSSISLQLLSIYSSKPQLIDRTFDLHCVGSIVSVNRTTGSSVSSLQEVESILQTLAV